MINRTIIENHLQDYFKIFLFNDIGVNGLQVQGKDNIKTIVTGVTICNELITKAITLNADALFVHHGLLFNSRGFTITNNAYKNIKILLKHDINLFAYHLPLDIHDKIGNNMLLGKKLGFTVLKRYDAEGISNILSLGTMKQAISNLEMQKNIIKIFNNDSFYIYSKNRSKIKKVAWCCGSGQDLIEKAVAIGADAYITGEISHRKFHMIQDLDINFYAIGHHHSEKYGINALGQYLAKKFNLKHHFLDVFNPL